MFNLKIKKSIIKVTEREPIASGASKVYSVRFEFDDEWQGLVKTAVFRAGDVSVSVLAENGICTLPWEVLAPENEGKVLWAGVFGSDESGVKLPTVWNVLGVIAEGAKMGEESREPSPSVVAEIFGAAKKAEAAAEGAAKNIAAAEAIINRFDEVSSELTDAAREIALDAERISYIADSAEKRITNLERHVSPEYFVTDETAAYEKAVPADACPYAEVESVGGMTHKVNVSRNLIPFPYKEANGAERYGLTFTYDDSGAITISGTISEELTANAFFYLCNPITLPAGTYTLSGFPSGSALSSMMFVDETGMNSIMCTGERAATVTFEEEVTFTTCGIEFTCNDVGQEINVTMRPMLNEGSTALPYERYREELVDTPVTAVKSLDADGNVISSITIPEAVQSLDGYGRGITKYANTVDLETCKYFKNVGVKAFNGTESWSEYKVASGYPNGLHCYQRSMPEKKLGYQTSFCSHFTNENSVFGKDNAKIGYYSDNNNYNPVYFISDKPNVTEWKAYLSEQAAAGTPVTLVYALAEPTEEDISDKLTDIDNLIEVAGGGKLIFENEGKRGAHSSVTYMLEEVTA